MFDMKISPVSSKNSELKEFGENEWKYANAEHYGGSEDHDYNQLDLTLKASIDGQIVGSLKCSHEAGVVYLHYLIVARDKKGQGIGKALMAEVETFATKYSAHKIHLMTGIGWGAENFYKKLGFRQVATLPNHHFHHDFVIYEKDLI